MNVIYSTKQYDFIPLQDVNEIWVIMAVNKMTGTREVVGRYNPYRKLLIGFSKDRIIAEFEKLLNDKHYKLLDTFFMLIIKI